MRELRVTAVGRPVTDIGVMKASGGRFVRERQTFGVIPVGLTQAWGARYDRGGHPLKSLVEDRLT